MAGRRRIDLWTAVRAGIVALLMSSFVTGFGQSDELLLGTHVIGTPTVGILGGAAATGNQLSGQIVGIDTLKSPPVLIVATTAGQTSVLLRDQQMLAGLGIGLTATFSGTYLAADVFSAYQAFPNGPVVAGGPPGAYNPVAPDGDISLGAPITGVGSSSASGTSGGGAIIFGEPTSGGSDSGNENSSNGNSSSTSDGDSNGNAACESSSNDNTTDNTNGNSDGCAPRPTATPKPASCAGGLVVAVDPRSASVAAGSNVNLTISLGSNASCGTQSVWLRIEGGPHAMREPVMATVNPGGSVVFSYQGFETGSDSVKAWVELNGDGKPSDNEPSARSTVTWTGQPVVGTPVTLKRKR